MTKNVKLFKNSERNSSEIQKKYVPHYQLMGIMPEEISGSGMTESSILIKSNPLPLTNPRNRRSLAREASPYVETMIPPLIKNSTVPNIGNNVECAWSSIDGEIVDDISQLEDANHPMIDNNEFVTSKALGINDEEVTKTYLTEEELKNTITTDANICNIPSIKEDEYILFINDNIINIGAHESIQEEVKSLVFGTHKDYEILPIENISVLKKIKIKIGVFLE